MFDRLPEYLVDASLRGTETRIYRAKEAIAKAVYANEMEAAKTDLEAARKKWREFREMKLAYLEERGKAS